MKGDQQIYEQEGTRLQPRGRSARGRDAAPVLLSPPQRPMPGGASTQPFLLTSPADHLVPQRLPGPHSDMEAAEGIRPTSWGSVWELELTNKGRGPMNKYPCPHLGGTDSSGRCSVSALGCPVGSPHCPQGPQPDTLPSPLPSLLHPTPPLKSITRSQGEKLGGHPR